MSYFPLRKSGIFNLESGPGADGEEGGWGRIPGSSMSMPIVDGWCGVAGVVSEVASFVRVVWALGRGMSTSAPGIPDSGSGSGSGSVPGLSR